MSVVFRQSNAQPALRFCLPQICTVLVLLLAQVSAEERQVAKPSLDVLLSRVRSYWALLSDGKKLQALNYVSSSNRKAFLSRQTPKFSLPRVVALKLSDRSDEVAVTVEVKRELPPLGSVDWPVEEKWIFARGNWFVAVADLLPPYSLSQKKTTPSTLAPAEIERRRQAIREALQFENQEINFGTVREGNVAYGVLKYRLSGNEAMQFRLENAPSGFGLVGVQDGKLPPGENQEVRAQWITSDYSGAFDVLLTIWIRNQDVEVPYQFKIRGSVYSPVSFLPSRLFFLPKERQKDVTLTNNSGSEIQIKSILSQTGIFEAQAIPLVLPPGGKYVLSLSLSNVVDKTNQQDLVTLVLAQPVEGMNSIDIPVILNYEKPREEKRIMGLTPQQLDELLKKSRPPKP